MTRSFIASALTPLFIIAAIAVGLVALISLPREEEPQISVPMVEIHVQAPGLRAEDAVKLVTEPLETIVKGIDGVEHIYSQTRDDYTMLTARFLVGTSADAAVLRVHDKMRANMDRIPVGIPEPLIVGRGIDDVAIVSLTLAPNPVSTGITANDLTRIARELRTEVAKTEDVGLTYLVGEATEAIRIAPDPEKLALYGVTLQQLAGKVQQANRSLNTGKLRDAGEQVDLVVGETLTVARPSGEPAVDHARWAAGLCGRCGGCGICWRHFGSHRLEPDARREWHHHPHAGGYAGGGQTRRIECRGGGRSGPAQGRGAGRHADPRKHRRHHHPRLWRNGQ